MVALAAGLVIATAALPSPAAAGRKDRIAPSAPTGLAITGTTASAVSLSWQPSSDNRAVVGYGLYRNGVRVAKTTSTTATFGGLACGTTYTLGVDAYDVAGNRSAVAAVLASTSACPDVTPPGSPGSVAQLSATATSITLTWAPALDDVGVAGYGAYRDGALVGSTAAWSYEFGWLACGSTYTLGVDAYDWAGNRAPVVSIVAATSPCADTEAPTAPAGLRVAEVTATSIALEWSPASDDVGVAGYGVDRDGSRVATTTQVRYTVGGLDCGAAYRLAVDAYDAAGNRSPRTSLSAETAACALSGSQPPTGESFPRSIWTDSTLPPEQLAQVKALGFGYAQVDPLVSQLDAVRAAGLRAIVWLGNINDETCVWNWSDERIRSGITAARNHPATAVYFVADEPHAACAAQVRERNALVKSLDPLKPTFMTENRREDFDELANITDIFGIIRYPCSYASGCVPAKITESMNAARAAGISSWWGVPQVFHEPSGGYYRAPSPTELQTILETWEADPGTVGYFFYTWGDGCCGDDIGLLNHSELWDTVTLENAVSSELIPLPPPPPPPAPAPSLARPEWLVWGNQVSNMLKVNADLTRWAYDRPGTYIIGSDPPGDQTKVPAGWQANTTVKFESYTDFEGMLSQIDPAVECVVYDPEGWTLTPDAEKADPATYMRRFVDTARAAGYTCIGLTPSRDLAGHQPGPCPTSGNLSQRFLNCGIARMAAEADPSFLEIQSQVLENDPATYKAFLTAAVNQARAVKPSLPILGGLSTSPYTVIATPEMLLAAYDATWPTTDLNGNQLVQGYKTFVGGGEEAIMLGFFQKLRDRAT